MWLMLKNLLPIACYFTGRASTVTRATAAVNTYNVEVYVTLDGVREQVTDFCTSCTYVVS